MKSVFVVLFLFIGVPAVAEIVVPVRTIRAREVISSEDLAIKSVNISGVVSNPTNIIGQEARIVLYAGRPINLGDVGQPALISRNDLVVLIFSQGSLRIATDGRALGRGAVGDSIRVMNLASRTTVVGTVRIDGSIEVK